MPEYGRSGPIDLVEFHPNSNYLASAHNDDTIHLWNIHNQNSLNLSHLKCFSLQYDCSNDAYDGEILPLLRRMSNIEVLNLNLIIDSPVSFIDDQQVECMIKYRRFPDVKYHLFSLPFMFDGLQFLDNTFPNIIFNHVIRLVVDDNIPFEHEFFMRIAWCFPLLKVLTVYNATSQSPILNYNDNQLYPTTIEYPYLTSLYLLLVHGDYVNRFLNDRKTHLPHLTVLSLNKMNNKNTLTIFLQPNHTEQQLLIIYAD
ncbi:unnamed protein product [Rotaria sp. Silwood1]|nr:unnamed protein product [Rotaria sp. Silwood1]